MGAFAGANFDLVSQLKKELEGNEKELQNIKQDLAQAEAHHSQEIQHLKNEYEEKLNKLHGQNDYLKQQLEKADHLTEK